VPVAKNLLLKNNILCLIFLKHNDKPNAEIPANNGKLAH